MMFTIVGLIIITIFLIIIINSVGSFNKRLCKIEIIFSNLYCDIDTLPIKAKYGTEGRLKRLETILSHIRLDMGTLGMR